MKSRPQKSIKPNRNDAPNRSGPAQVLGVRRWIWFAFVGIGSLGLGLFGFRWYNEREAKRLEEACVVANQNQDWPSLEQMAVRWGLLQPTRFEPFLMAAHAAEQQGDKVRTAGYLLEMPPDTPVSALLKLSFLQYEDLNDPLGSIRTCEKIREREPKNSEAHERLLFFWTMTRNTPKIRSEANRGIRDGCATITTYAYLFGAEKLRFGDALETNRRWLQSAPKEELFLVPAVLSHIALLARIEPGSPTEDADLAENKLKIDSDLNQLSVDFPSNLEVFAARLEREIDRGDEESVEAILRSGTANFEKDNRYWRAKAWLHSARKDYPQAKECCDRAIQIEPLDWQAYFIRSTVFRLLGKRNEVEQDSKVGYLGSDLTKQLNSSTKVFSLERTFYERLASFAELCDQAKIASGIRSQLSTYVPEAAPMAP
jgi:tetratricopeptide (TPR) repeat protein